MLAQSRIALPVLGGISGWNKTTSNIGGARPGVRPRVCQPLLTFTRFTMCRAPGSIEWKSTARGSAGAAATEGVSGGQPLLDVLRANQISDDHAERMEDVFAQIVLNGLSADVGDDLAEREEAARARGVFQRTSLGRLGRNRECIGAAIYFASDESSFTSGQRINVDGGRF